MSIISDAVIKDRPHLSEPILYIDPSIQLGPHEPNLLAEPPRPPVPQAGSLYLGTAAALAVLSGGYQTALQSPVAAAQPSKPQEIPSDLNKSARAPARRGGLIRKAGQGLALLGLASLVGLGAGAICVHESRPARQGAPMLAESPAVATAERPQKHARGKRARKLRTAPVQVAEVIAPAQAERATAKPVQVAEPAPTIAIPAPAPVRASFPASAVYAMTTRQNLALAETRQRNEAAIPPPQAPSQAPPQAPIDERDVPASAPESASAVPDAPPAAPPATEVAEAPAPRVSPERVEASAPVVRTRVATADRASAGHAVAMEKLELVSSLESVMKAVPLLKAMPLQTAWAAKPAPVRTPIVISDSEPIPSSPEVIAHTDVEEVPYEGGEPIARAPREANASKAVLKTVKAANGLKTAKVAPAASAQQAAAQKLALAAKKEQAEDSDAPGSSKRRMTVEGIFWDKKRPLALINGEIVEIGSKLGTFEVVDIKPGAVTIMKDGVRIALHP